VYGGWAVWGGWKRATHIIAYINYISTCTRERADQEPGVASTGSDGVINIRFPFHDVSALSLRLNLWASCPLDRETCYLSSPVQPGGVGEGEAGSPAI